MTAIRAAIETSHHWTARIWETWREETAVIEAALE
jgi:hypothetical protein